MYSKDTDKKSTSSNRSVLRKFFGPEFDSWKSLDRSTDESNFDEASEEFAAQLKAANEQLKGCLRTSLQMQHVIVLSGCGTSLGPTTKGPSMKALWEACVDSNSDAALMKKVGYDAKNEAENIEALLSQCEAFQLVRPDAAVAEFLTESKRTILNQCSKFLTPNSPQLDAHKTFLRRLARRRARDSRLKVFTTNYDLCFENAAGELGLVVMDGFSFSAPRRFDSKFFRYDIVARPSTGDEIGTPLEGVFHLCKLHGSVNWERDARQNVIEKRDPDPDRACLIYPAKGKYQQAFLQPHLEMLSQYLAALREPNTCLVVVGFGFNDDHLAEPILSAMESNPHLRLIIVDPNCQARIAKEIPSSNYWEKFFALSQRGEDVWFLNMGFGDFAQRIPDLKSLTPAQRIANGIADMMGVKS